MGSTGSEWGTGITLDDSGNTYTVGNFQGTVDFDPGKGISYLSSAGSYDIFVLKFDPNGNFVWARGMGGGGEDDVNSIAIDFSGCIYTTGFFNGTADFDPGTGTRNLTSYGYTDIFVSKLDPSGNFLWVKQIGGTGIDKGKSINASTLGFVHITGYFQRTVDFDPGSGTYDLTSLQGNDIFISKLTSVGNFKWARSIEGTDDEQINSIAVDKMGNVFTTGAFGDYADFDPGMDTFRLKSLGFTDIFILKLNVNGNFIWACRIGSPVGENAYSIAVDNEGYSYTTGVFQRTIDFDPDSGTYNLTPTGGDIFILKLDSAGKFQWAKGMGGANNETGDWISLDDSGNVYTTGHFQGICDFDPGSGFDTLVSKGTDDVFVSKLDKNGNHIWVKGFGGIYNDWGESIAVDAYGSVYTTGDFRETVDFDTDTSKYYLSSKGTGDLFIHKLVTCSSKPSSSGSISGPTVACKNDTATYSVNPVSGAIGYNWSLPSECRIINGKNTNAITVIYGSYSGKVKVTPFNPFGNGKSDSIFVLVKPIPSVGYTLSPSSIVCKGTSVTFYGSGAATYKWTNGITDGVSFVPDSSNTYIVTGTDTNGCHNTSSALVLVNPLPVIRIDASPSSSVCSETQVTLKGNGGLSYAWSKGITDGVPFTPSITSTYSVIGKDSNGCFNKDSVLITVNTSPIIGFTATPSNNICSGSSVSLRGTGASKYVWRGLVSDGVTFTPDSTRSYWVIGIDSNNCFDSLNVPVTVFSKAVADFSTQGICELDSIRFINISKNADKYNWRFGDGQISNQKSPNHLYKTGGVSKIYNVSLNSSNDGCSDSVTKPVTIKPNPRSDFSFTKTGNKFDFKASQKDNTLYQWNFGNNDSASSSSTDYSYTYSQSNTYSVCLKVTSADNCFSETCKNISTIGISKTSKQSGINIYPNPNSGRFEVQIEKPENESVISVYNAVGQLVAAFPAQEGQTTYPINLEVSNGIYLVKIETGGMTFCERVVVTDAFYK